ncbi:MAG TPA: Hpt domain-containing protein, partial [Ramlibacter sp.]|nr:Hpt domain-containing protein [Ramlibacter sp.]
ALAQLPTLAHGMPRDESTRLLHTLKSTAATLGANPLSLLAAEGERACKELGSVSDGLVERLRQGLRETLAAVEAALPAEDPAPQS